MSVNLSYIFRYLVDDSTFISQIIETDYVDKKKKKKNDSMMSQMITDYNTLPLYQLQTMGIFPDAFHKFLLFNKKYMRGGIKTTAEKNFTVINISFLNSLNILLRPDLFYTDVNNQIKSLHALEEFITHKMQRNYQIDRTKNTKKVQNIHNELVSVMYEGKVTTELIQYIVDIFEINLIIFDFAKIETNLYWARGTKYPFYNPVNQVYFMGFIQGNYEPIFNKKPSSVSNNLLNATILENSGTLKTEPIVLSVPSLFIIDSWDVSQTTYLNIIQKYYQPTNEL